MPEGEPACPNPEPEPKLNVFETFLHLRPWQRVACVVCCFVAYVLCIQPTFTANVAPHFMAIVRPDGSFNVHELIQTLTLSSFVVLLTASPLLMLRAPWFGKVGIVVMSLFIAYTTLDNACDVQKEGLATKNDAPRQKADRIARLDVEIDGATKAYQQVPAHEYVTAATVKRAEADLANLTKSADDECGRGTWGSWAHSSRGPKCEKLEKQRDEKGAEVTKLQRNADLTQRAADIEVALSQLKSERKELGAAPEITGNELERFPAFLADFGVPMGFAKALSRHHPEIVATTQELIAWFGSPAAVAFVFWLFSLLSCEKTEADKRVHETTIRVAANYAAKAAAELPVMEADEPEQVPAPPKVIRPDVWFNPVWMKDEPQPETQPETNHAEVLGIDEPQPAFVEKPETAAEAMAAAFIKADPEKKPRRPRKPKGELEKPHKSTVVQWHRERCFEFVGRVLWSTECRPDYERWCWQHGYEPVPPQTFGRTLRKECVVRADNTSRGGKYYDIGLRPAGLRVVA